MAGGVQPNPFSCDVERLRRASNSIKHEMLIYFGDVKSACIPHVRDRNRQKITGSAIPKD
jgi:hypothetical protein